MIRRPLWVWLAFAAVVAVLASVMAWMSLAMLRMEHRELQRDAMEVNVRRSLWRMDSFVAPIIAAENARPYYYYESFFNSPEAYTRLFEPIEWGDVRVPSPLLTEDSRFVRLHFQWDPQGSLESPQVPRGNMRDVAEVDYITSERLESYEIRLKELSTQLEGNDLDTALATTPRSWTADATDATSGAGLADTLTSAGVTPQQFDIVPQTASPQIARQMEDESRQAMVTNTEARFDVMRQQSAKARAGQVQAPALHVHEEAMTPLWIGEQLLLVRRVTIEDREVYQGCWLDWAAIREYLLKEVGELLPAAELKPITAGQVRDEPFVLRAIPVAVTPGPIPVLQPAGFSHTELSLLVAWVGMTVAAIAAGLLLHGVLALSERRATFVSIVTHELRTPLTTFRLYTDLLARPQADASKHAGYVDTLSSEAGRLSQLVENVLAYSRIERGRSGVVASPVRLGPILDRVRPCLEERTARAEMRLHWHITDEHASRVVIAQEGAVGQILTNLVDNACKYARSTDDPSITITTRLAGRRLGIAIEDRGPGIEPGERHALFAPFRKLTRDAAGTKPGIGLGLALSRRLARELGGDLTVDPTPTPPGARFTLWLRTSD